MNVLNFGKTATGLMIPAFRFGDNVFGTRPEVLILGGVHGDEIEGVIASQGLLEKFLESFSFDLNVTLVPMMNLDGVLNKNRTNSRGVDLNRNLPTKDWSPTVATPRYHPGSHPASEVENQNLMHFLDVQKPQFVLSLHSWHPVLNVNGDCLEEANALSQSTGYKVDASIGYPTPGCLGTYAGLERNWPTLTYEIERGLGTSEILNVHVPAILNCLKVTEGKSR